MPSGKKLEKAHSFFEVTKSFKAFMHFINYHYHCGLETEISAKIIPEL